MTTKIPLPTESYFLDATGAADQRLINVYGEPTPAEGGMTFILQGTPGLTLLGDPGNGGPVRGMVQTITGDGNTLFVSGANVYFINTGTPTLLGTIDPAGTLTLASDGVNVIMCCNSRAFLYNGSTLTEITGTLPFVPVSVTWVEGFFVFTSSPNIFFISGLNSATSFDPLDFATAQASADVLLGCATTHLDLWLFSSTHAEIWYLSGAADFAFQRQLGGVIEYGTASPASIATVDNTIMWLGHDRKVYKANGYTPQCISTPAVERFLQNAEVVGDCIGMQTSLEGHNNYVMVLPTANFTWAYNSTNDKWYELASSGVGTRWRGNCALLTNFNMMVGDSLTGAVMLLTKDAFTELGAAMFRMVQFPALYGGGNPYFPVVQFPNDYAGGRRMFFTKLMLDFFGAGQTITLTWSKDSGQTFTSPGRSSVTNSLRTFFTRLGSFRRIILCLTCTSNSQFALYDAQADIDGGQY